MKNILLVINTLDIFSIKPTEDFLSSVKIPYSYKNEHIVSYIIFISVNRQIQQDLPSKYSHDLKRISEEKSVRSNKLLNKVFGFQNREGVHCVELSIAPSELTNAKDKEDYVLRTAESFKNWNMLTMHHIFDPLPNCFESPWTVLLVAGAGMGKTTVCQERSFRWSSDTDSFQRQAVFRFECRKFRMKEATSQGQQSVTPKVLSLEELIFDIHGPYVDNKNQRRLILDQLNSSETEFIFDGLDELDVDIDKGDSGEEMCDPYAKTTISNLIYNLREGNLFRNARVLCSSRPNNSVSLHDYNRVVVALGFSRRAIKECIKALCEAQCGRNESVSYFDLICRHLEQSQLYVYCFVPLICVILGVVLLHDIQRDDDTEKPIKFTHVFIRATEQILSKLSGHGAQKINGSNFRGRHLLENATRCSLISLMRLAAEGMFAEPRQIVFDAQDLHRHNIDQTVLSCGLLENTTEDMTVFQDCENTVASFIHLTHQEFLTAVFLAITWNEYMLEEVISKLTSRKYDIVLLCLAGLLGDADKGHAFIRSINSLISSHTLSLRGVELISMMSNQVTAENTPLNKNIKLHILLCLKEGNFDHQMTMDLFGNLVDFSLMPQGLLPHHLVAVGSYIVSNQHITVLK